MYVLYYTILSIWLSSRCYLIDNYFIYSWKVGVVLCLINIVTCSKCRGSQKWSKISWHKRFHASLHWIKDNKFLLSYSITYKTSNSLDNIKNLKYFHVIFYVTVLFLCGVLFTPLWISGISLWWMANKNDSHSVLCNNINYWQHNH